MDGLWTAGHSCAHCRIAAGAHTCSAQSIFNLRAVGRAAAWGTQNDLVLLLSMGLSEAILFARPSHVQKNRQVGT